jgi:Domain of unknown function (DUF5134)
MTGPGWLAPGLAALMLLITASCIIRLARWRRRRPAEPDVDALHAVMGVAMAGMLLPDLSLVPAPVWRALFGIAAAWFAARAIRSRARMAGHHRRFPHPAPHAVESAAMIYMLIPARGHSTGRMAMAGMQASAVANPVVTLLFAVFLVAYMLWTADRFTARDRASGPADNTSGLRGPLIWSSASPALTPQRADGVSRFTAIDKIVMSTAMGYMLLTML